MKLKLFRPKRKKRDLVADALQSLPLDVKILYAVLEEGKTSPAIARHIKATFGTAAGSWNVYPAVHRLIKTKLLSAYWTDPEAFITGNDPRYIKQCFYCITDAGMQVLQDLHVKLKVEQ